MSSRLFQFVVVVVAAFSLSCVRKNSTIPKEQIAALTEERAPAVIAIAAADGDRYTLCSGALVARNLVLTARHCVSKALTSNPSCDAAGRSHNGAHVDKDLDPQDISIYEGPHHLPVLPLRSHAPVTEGDVVVPIGFGGGTANAVGTRVPRKTSQVLATGPGANARTGAVLGPREFEVESATCRGDSGGPAIDARSGEIVGVVSRGASCSALGNHVYTRVDAFQKLTALAFLQADRQMREAVAHRER